METIKKSGVAMQMTKRNDGEVPHNALLNDLLPYLTAIAVRERRFSLNNDLCATYDFSLFRLTQNW